MAVGRLKCAVLDVSDLGIAETFWSEVTGLPVIPSPFPGRYSYLGTPEPWDHELILHRVKTPKGSEVNRAHVDIWVRSIDDAITQVEELGGSLKREPTVYPRPHSFPGERPVLDWAVMRDPFGNEFCLVTILSREQARAVTEAGRDGDVDDHRLRLAAGLAHP